MLVYRHNKVFLSLFNAITFQHLIYVTGSVVSQGRYEGEAVRRVDAFESKKRFVVRELLLFLDIVRRTSS